MTTQDPRPEGGLPAGMLGRVVGRSVIDSAQMRAQERDHATADAVLSLALTLNDLHERRRIPLNTVGIKLAVIADQQKHEIAVLSGIRTALCVIAGMAVLSTIALGAFIVSVIL